MTDLAGDTKNTKKLLPTGQVLGVLGLKYRTLYNYLRDFGEYFSESSRVTKKGKRWTPDDLSVIQTIRHLHSERQSKEAIKQHLTEGYTVPMGGSYRPEDINRLIEASWIFLQEAHDQLEKTKAQFKRCEFCEWDLRYHIDKGFYKTIFRYEEFEHELNQIKLIVGRISDSHIARQQRDEEYNRLEKWIRYDFLAKEERRVKKQEELEGVGVETAKAKLKLVHDVKAMTGWLYDKLPRRSNKTEE